MPRSATLLALFWAVRAAVLEEDPAARENACRFCSKLCPISCFVGTCGFDYGFVVRKFEATNQCYSCDPATSVGVSRNGDFMKCRAEESGGGGNPAGGPSVFETGQSAHAIDAMGPPISGDAGLHARKAAAQAKIATIAAENGAIWADKAADAAVAKYQQVTGNSSNGAGGFKPMSDVEIAEQHQMATQVRAEDALRVSETAHIAWKAALADYNNELEKLRRQQVITEQAEKRLEAAEMASEKARGAYAAAQAESQKAAEAMVKMGGNAAGKITAQAAAEELAGAARAAHRRLVIAAKEAKDASDKISIATDMKPCKPSLIQVEGGQPVAVGCQPIKNDQEQDTSLSTPKITPLVVAPARPMQYGDVPEVTEQDDDDSDEEEDEDPVPTSGVLEVPNVEQQMVSNLAMKIADDPAVAQDPLQFAAPAVPFSSEQTPVDGTESVPGFDMSTISALQTQKYGRRMLRSSHSGVKL